MQVKNSTKFKNNFFIYNITLQWLIDMAKELYATRLQDKLHTVCNSFATDDLWNLSVMQLILYLLGERIMGNWSA